MNFSKYILLVFVLQTSMLQAGQVFSAGQNLKCGVCAGAINKKKPISGLCSFHSCKKNEVICQNCDCSSAVTDCLRCCQFCNKNLDEERLNMLRTAFDVDDKDNLDRDHKDLLMLIKAEVLNENSCRKSNVLDFEEHDMKAAFNLLFNIMISSHDCYFVVQKCAKKRRHELSLRN
jgi:hypothetical protein